MIHWDVLFYKPLNYLKCHKVHPYLIQDLFAHNLWLILIFIWLADTMVFGSFGCLGFNIVFPFYCQYEVGQ